VHFNLKSRYWWNFGALQSEGQVISGEPLVEALFSYLVPLVEGYLDLMSEAEASSWLPDYPEDGKFFVDNFSIEY
jgi:hypothetical protein